MLSHLVADEIRERFSPEDAERVAGCELAAVGGDCGELGRHPGGNIDHGMDLILGHTEAFGVDAADAFVVKAELPGVTPEQVQIEVENETLTLRGERAFSEPSGEAAYHRRERGVGQFRRVIRMPGRLDPEGAKAECRDGVLTVRIPKHAKAKPRRIAIGASSNAKQLKE